MSLTCLPVKLIEQILILTYLSQGRQLTAIAACNRFVFIRGPSLVQKRKWEADSLRERKAVAYSATNDTNLKLLIAQLIICWSDCSRQ